MTAAAGYDGFISYSHEHDAVLGPMLQTNLERFAKPWYKMRALRIFLDAADLGANPGLWPSIEDGLRSSQWFILLASVDAAASKWVNREAQWWIDHGSRDRLLVVGTSPGLDWDERKGDWAADAPVPSALRGAFRDEPHWVDLSEVQLDGRRPRIPPNKVAAVAAPLRGRRLDELFGEHLRQHRRAMRLAEGALAVMAVLTVLAVAFGVYAYVERNTAIQQRDQAIANQVIFEASQLTTTDPSLAAQFDVTANQFYSRPASETRLLATTTTPLASRLTGPAGVVYSVAFSQDGKILAAGGEDDKVWLWNMADPAHPARTGQPLTGPSGSVNSVAFSPDGKILAAGSGDHKVWLWNMADPAHPARLGQPLTGPSGSVNSVAFSPDGKTLAAGGQDDKVWLWNMADPAHPARLGQPLTGPTSSLFSVGFSPDGKILAAGGDDHKVWLWNMADPAHPARLGQPLTGPTNIVISVGFSPDGKILAAGGDDDKVWLWNMADPAHPARLGQPLTGPTQWVDSVAFSPDGKILAAGSADHKVWLWNMADPAHPAGLDQPLTGSTNLVSSVAFSPDGKTLAAAGSDQAIRLWHLPSTVLTGPTGMVESVAFSPDGKILAAGSDDDKVWLWNMADRAHPARLGQPLTGPANLVYSVAFSPDGKILAAGSDDHKVWLWNMADPAHPARLGAAADRPHHLGRIGGVQPGWEDPGCRQRRRQDLAVEYGRPGPSPPGSGSR